MRRRALLVALAPLAGCSLTAPEPPVAVRPFDAEVAGVPLGPAWDRDVFGANGPDVYVQVLRVDAPVGTVFRTLSAPDVRQAALPLRLESRGTRFGSYAAVPVDARVVVEVHDEVTEDDLMFRSDTLRFGDLDRGNARAGDAAAFDVVTTETEFRLRFRWE